MNLIFILFFASCITSTRSFIKNARTQFPKGFYCNDIIKQKMNQAGCTQLLIDESATELTVRCHKEDKDRGEFWDNWVFRITRSDTEINPEAFVEVRQHTICIDQNIRIEAYPPSIVNMTLK